MVKPQTKRKKNTNGIGLRGSGAVLPLLENRNPERLPDQGKNLINKS